LVTDLSKFKLSISDHPKNKALFGSIYSGILTQIVSKQTTKRTFLAKQASFLPGQVLHLASKNTIHIYYRIRKTKKKIFFEK
jgi:hypothetical protein